MSESPAKRPRTAGSFSPPSPPYHHSAKSTTDRSTAFQPNTPASPPPYMSPNARPDAPPSSASASLAHDSFSPSTAPTSQAPTQEHQLHHSQHEKASDEVMADAPEYSTAPLAAADGGAIMSDADGHRRTDHDRQSAPGLRSPEKATLEPLEGKEKRKETSQSLFKLCEQPYAAARPQPMENLVRLYGLNPIAASVARRDPLTGAKINKLRKSYEGQIKQFQLSGRNKAVSSPGEFMDLVQYPDEEWHIQKEMGHDISKGLPAATLAKLERAMQNIPIKTSGPPWEEWKSIIGTDEQRGAVKPGTTASQADPAAAKNRHMLGGAVQQQQQQSLGNRSTAASPMPPRPARPERAGTKRRYNNSSFEGYGEGYGDDDLGDSGDDDGRNGAKKRRRKDTYGATSPLGMDASSGYRARVVDMPR